MWLKEIIKALPPFKKIISERESFREKSKSLVLQNEKLIKDNDRLSNENQILINKNKENLEKKNNLKKENNEIFKEKENLGLKNNFLEEKIGLLNKNIENLNIINYKNKEIIKKNNIEIESLYLKLNKLNEESLKIADFNSGEFWEQVYINGGNSGSGSYNKLAEFKAEIVNFILDKHSINNVIEIGCGDGNQLSLINYQNYTGVDVSKTIIKKNKLRYKDKTNIRFFNTNEREKFINNSYDMSISMDVIFHLLEQDIFENYMKDLFALSKAYVVIYSSNHEEYTKYPEYRHRNFTKFVADNFSNWELIKYIPNKYPYIIGKEEETSSSDFYIYKK